MRVLILANAPGTAEQRLPGEDLSDREVEEVAAAVQCTLRRQGLTATTFLVADPAALLRRLRRERPDVVFNLCETLNRQSGLEPAVPYLLAWLGIPFTGNRPEQLALLVDKITTKRLLLSHGLPTPAFKELTQEADLKDWRHWPAFLKPAREDASLGIDRRSVAPTAAAARRKFKALAAAFGTPVLIEAFVAGRELNMAMMDTPRGLVWGINEIAFSPSLPPAQRIITYNSKWLPDSEEDLAAPVKSPADLTPALEKRVVTIARRTFAAFHLRGYARIDFRVDARGRPFILEINPNPDLAPDAGFGKSLRQMGFTYHDAIVNLLTMAKTQQTRG